MRIYCSVIFLLTYFIGWSFQSKMTIETYIETYKHHAVKQMKQHGIPASITMAQGLLESGYGNSMLAVKGNNHFGIKCHDWEGARIYKDDDKRNECFRKYDDPIESYEDHSRFLTGRSRYAFLFELDKRDYKAWAEGLKKAGYATNPKYDKLLIDLIEKYELYKLDEEGDIELIEPEKKNIKSSEPLVQQKKEKKQEEISTVNTHKVHVNEDRTKYVIAKKGDTFYQISKEFGFSLRQLNRWNDFPRNKDILEEGDIIYLMPKRKRSKSNVSQVRLEENKELWMLSQQYGIKLKSLMELNGISSPDLELSKGDIVFLR
ncbi:MAG: glucosaminidase domain-containing protein [Brumimicrobium sp.]|nr:glucosaminidase domain-containing protein [Brumimicrobium sp.]